MRRYRLPGASEMMVVKVAERLVRDGYTSFEDADVYAGAYAEATTRVLYTSPNSRARLHRLDSRYWDLIRGHGPAYTQLRTSLYTSSRYTWRTDGVVDITKVTDTDVENKVLAARDRIAKHAVTLHDDMLWEELRIRDNTTLIEREVRIEKHLISKVRTKEEREKFRDRAERRGKPARNLSREVGEEVARRIDSAFAAARRRREVARLANREGGPKPEESKE